jgi:tetratricopeptide (TPR) repeat protein
MACVTTRLRCIISLRRCSSIKYVFCVLALLGAGAAISSGTPDVDSGTNDPGTAATSPPSDYSGAALTNALLTKLSRDEIRLVVNPLVTNVAMKQWAEELTKSATSGEGKARLLFEAFTERLKKQGVLKPVGLRTASEVLDLWNRPQTTFYCKDFTFLYVTSARTLGLQAFVVEVEEALDGSKTPHCCAAVFLNNGAILVDPVFLTFGARHKRFKLLDDIQVIGLYLAESPSMEQRIAASKLAPDRVQVVLCLFKALQEAGDWDKCRALLPTIQSLDFDGAETNYALALLAISTGEPEQAAELARKCLTVNPRDIQYHSILVDAYAQEGKIEAAREACEKALLLVFPPVLGEQFRDWLSHTNKLAARAWEQRAFAKLRTGDWGTAATLLTAAIRIDPQSASSHLNRGVAKQNLGDLDGAYHDYIKAATLNPDLTPSVAPRLYFAGCMHYSIGEFSKSRDELAKVCEMAPEDDDAHFRLWAARSRLGESAIATKDLQAYLQARRYTLNEWPSKLGQFLIGSRIERELFDDTKSADINKQAGQQCQGYYYAAVKRLLRGDRAVATLYLQECLATSATNSIEHASALVEIKRFAEYNSRSPAGKQ